MLSKFNLQSKALSKTWLFDITIIGLFLCIFYSIWLGSHPLFTPDEGRYSEAAREMVMSGDYITPRINGVVFLDKPILYYWLQASAIKLFGLNEFALRFWPALLGVLSCLFMYLAGHQLFNRRTGIISALILATTPLYYGGAHYANLDLEVGSLISITLLSFMVAIHTNGRLRTPAFITAYFFAGLACLTKGLIGAVFPALIGGLWIVLLNRWSLFKNMRLVTGILLFAAIVLPWYTLAQLANPQFFHYFFIDQQVSRFLTTAAYNCQNASWFYLPIIALGFFPWTVFVIQAIGQSLANIWKNRQSHSKELFLLLWVVVIFTFFSIPHSKTLGYILPIFPGLALLTGYYVNTQWQTKHKSFQLGVWMYIGITLAIVMGYLALPLVRMLGINNALMPYVTFTIALFFLSSITIFFLRNAAPNKIITVLFVTAVLFLLGLNISSTALNQKSIKPLAVYLKQVMKPEDEIAIYYRYYQDLPIYLEKRITMVADWAATDIPQNDNWVREMWYGMPYQDTSNWLILENAFWQRWHSQKHMFVMLNQSYFDEFRLKAHSHIYTLKRFNNVVLVSNQPAM